MPTKERFTNNINNPLLKTISSGNGLMEFPLSTERNLHTYLHGNSAGTPVEIACNSSGHLLVDITADSGSLHGLATEAKQDDIIANQTDGSSKVQVLGNTEADGSGDSNHIHVDGSGNLLTNVVNTVNIAPANSVNSHITDNPANSVAVGVKGRQVITDSSTETFCLVDAQGHMQVDVLSGSVEINYSYGSEHTIISSQTIANGDTFTSGEFEIQSVKNIQAIISLSVSAGGSTNYDVGFEGSLNGSDFYEFPDSTIIGTSDAILSTEKAGIVPVRYMKVKITNQHGSGSHTFTVKGSVLGATLATP